ncbi:hypothetical protein SeMB42_g05465 [Synchytrium endobioticum]|nr:hypothetical protein SeMB42_g05465 [Synchytrium endobioticum]
MTTSVRRRLATTETAAKASAVASQAVANTTKAASHVVSRVTGLVEPILYYGQVGLELVRQVAVHQRLTNFNVAEAQQGYANFLAAFQNGTWRNVTLRHAAGVAVKGVEIVGFFCVGEMIGRRHVIGYDIPGAHRYEHEP